MWSGTYEEIRVDRMSMKYSWLCSRYNLYCDYYEVDRAACAVDAERYGPWSMKKACWEKPPWIEGVIEFVISFPFPILVITIITYYLISRKIKESVVLILLTTVVSYFAWMILAVTIFDYIPSWFNHIDIQISYIIGILLQVLIVNFVSRLYLKFNKSNSNKPL
jgi:hypothetical protein